MIYLHLNPRFPQVVQPYNAPVQIHIAVGTLAGYHSRYKSKIVSKKFTPRTNLQELAADGYHEVLASLQSSAKLMLHIASLD